MRRSVSQTLMMAYDLEVELFSDTIICICAILCVVTCHNVLERQRFVFRTLDQFMQHLLTMDSDFYLIAHNGNHYDHAFIIQWCNQHDIPIRGPKGHYLCLTAYLYKCQMFFRDSIDYFKGSLASLGTWIGLPKLDMDLANPVPSAFIPYCMRDVEIVVKLISVGTTCFVQAFNLPYVLIYYFSIAHIAYLIQMKDIDVFQFTFVEQLHNILQTSYYGGRVYSCMYGMVKRGNLCCIDIRSQYPASLCRPYPCGTITRCKTRVPERLGIYFVEATRQWPGCITATKAIVPVRFRNTLGFVSHGKIRGWYCTPDIDAMIADNWFVIYLDGFVWSDTTTILRDRYVNLYALRKQTSKTDTMNQAYKLILNSSYGQFVHKYRAFDDRAKYIGWFCLAYTRCQLLTLMRLTKDQPVYYGDTDSIYCSTCSIPPHYLRNELSINPFDITVDCESYHKALYVVARKVYCTQDIDKVRAKGMRQCTMQNIIDACRKPVILPYLSRGVCSLTLWQDNWMVDAHNLSEKARTLTVRVPPYMFKCNVCSMYHSVTINMY
jgi:hypothetical protein